jgi:hypothetical protein
MAGSLADVLAKLDWAEHHYNFLRNELHGGWEFQERPVTMERHRDGLEYRFRVGTVEPLDPRWPLVIGDCLFNLRAALDHLVYQLHVRHFRGRFPGDAAQASAFPILIQPRRTKSGAPIPTDRWNEIKRLGKRERAAIERLQPYKRANREHRIWGEWLHWDRLALAEVHELNRIDKHRHLHVVASAAAAITKPEFAPEYGFESHPTWGALESHAEVDRWTFTKAPPHVPMHRGVYTAVRLDDGAEAPQVLPHLKGCINGVRRVVQRFANRF